MKARFKLTSRTTGKTVVVTLKGDEENVKKISDIIIERFKGLCLAQSTYAYVVEKTGAVRIPEHSTVRTRGAW